MNSVVACGLGILLASLSLETAGQTVADVARAQREKRAAAQNKAAKVFTHDGAPPVAAPPETAGASSIQNPLERQRKIAALELEIAGIEEGVPPTPAGIEGGALRTVSELRAEIQKLKDALPPLPNEPAAGTSYEEKQKRVYALMPENERAELLASLTQTLSKKDAAFREMICVEPKPECVPLAAAVSRTRRSLELLKSAPPPPAP